MSRKYHAQFYRHFIEFNDTKYYIENIHSTPTEDILERPGGVLSKAFRMNIVFTHDQLVTNRIDTVFDCAVNDRDLV